MSWQVLLRSGVALPFRRPRAWSDAEASNLSLSPEGREHPSQERVCLPKAVRAPLFFDNGRRLEFAVLSGYFGSFNHSLHFASHAPVPGHRQACRFRDYRICADSSTG